MFKVANHIIPKVLEKQIDLSDKYMLRSNGKFRNKYVRAKLKSQYVSKSKNSNLKNTCIMILEYS